MAKPVVLTLHAKVDLENISEWLSEKWNLKVLDDFLNLYRSKLVIIGAYPERYPFINQNLKLRKAVLTKHNIILYREKDDFIEIVSVFDTRQNRGKIAQYLKNP